MKRQIAIYRATGARMEAIQQLNVYLEWCMSDNEAWLELADLYLGQQLCYTILLFILIDQI